jgi:hypothetical protein
MIRYKNSLIILAAAALAGCATRSPMVVDQPVGPDLAPPKVNFIAGNGQLVVYSALEAANPINSDFPTHAGYEIDDADGKLVRHVDNRGGSFYQMPAAVSLPPGKYVVKAPATNYGLVTVPVVIKENETTTLDLEATHFRQHKPTGAGQWVRLPTGEVIGMRSP